MASTTTSPSSHGTRPRRCPGPCARELAVRPRVGPYRLSPGPTPSLSKSPVGAPPGGPRQGHQCSTLSAIQCSTLLALARISQCVAMAGAQDMPRRPAGPDLATRKTIDLSDCVRTCVHCIWPAPGAACNLDVRIDRRIRYASQDSQCLSDRLRPP
jgi:hypothetical protein